MVEKNILGKEKNRDPGWGFAVVQADRGAQEASYGGGIRFLTPESQLRGKGSPYFVGRLRLGEPELGEREKIGGLFKLLWDKKVQNIA